MPKINVLPKSVAELISAGEVVERPASVIKELIENSIDAGSDSITVEIRNGGITYMRVTDNGSGIESEDVRKAFLRHATSKIKNENDLDGIMTLGFRGEALAAVSSVAKVELVTKSPSEDAGTHYIIEGGEEKDFSEVGTADGTTIVIKDLFFNTPARMKFLKKDVTEGNAIMAVVERIALSHPEIAFKFIREGKAVINTSGDGKLLSAVYSVLGREFSSSLIEVNGEDNRISVTGYICKPVFCKSTRANQYFFLNGRLVRSGTVTAAVEQAYKNSAMVGKFPSYILNAAVPADTVDVNVHPAKTEVRFSNEKLIFDAVYYAVKNALSLKDTRPQISMHKPPKFSAFDRMTVEQYKQAIIKEPVPDKPEKTVYPPKGSAVTPPVRLEEPKFSYKDVPEKETAYVEPEPLPKEKTAFVPKKEKPKEEKVSENTGIKERSILGEIKYVGEVFSTYIAVEYGESFFLIDKHAAHERLNFERLKKTVVPEIQELLLPVTVKLPENSYYAVVNDNEIFYKAGFLIEDFGNGSVIVRGIPSALSGEDVENLVAEVAEKAAATGKAESQRLDDIFHTVSCKAAIKAGYRTSVEEQIKLAERVLLDDDIFYCPHGRPVAYEIKKKELEKQFGRIQ